MLTVLLLIVWVGKLGSWGFRIDPMMVEFGRRGQLHFYYGDISAIEFRKGYWKSGIAPLEKLNPWFESDRYYCMNSQVTRFSIPLWCLAILTATPTFLIWRRDRKRNPNGCPKCGYDRTGLPADRPCPECGNAASG